METREKVHAALYAVHTAEIPESLFNTDTYSDNAVDAWLASMPEACQGFALLRLLFEGVGMKAFAASYSAKFNAFMEQAGKVYAPSDKYSMDVDADDEQVIFFLDHDDSEEPEQMTFDLHEFSDLLGDLMDSELWEKPEQGLCFSCPLYESCSAPCKELPF